MVSSAGTTKERVSIAKQRSRARGAAMYLYVFRVVLEDNFVGGFGGKKWGVWTCETSVVGGGTFDLVAKEQAVIRE